VIFEQKVLENNLNKFCKSKVVYEQLKNSEKLRDFLHTELNSVKKPISFFYYYFFLIFL